MKCIQECIAGDPAGAAGDLSLCAATAPGCYPRTTACIELGKCCRGVPASLAVQKESCQFEVLRDNPESCTNLRSNPLFLDYCPKPDAATPVDAASDAPKDVAAQ